MWSFGRYLQDTAINLGSSSYYGYGLVQAVDAIDGTGSGDDGDGDDGDDDDGGSGGPGNGNGRGPNR
jgi:subtilisin